MYMLLKDWVQKYNSCELKSPTDVVATGLWEGNICIKVNSVGKTTMIGRLLSKITNPELVNKHYIVLESCLYENKTPYSKLTFINVQTKKTLMVILIDYPEYTDKYILFTEGLVNFTSHKGFKYVGSIITWLNDYEGCTI